MFNCLFNLVACGLYFVFFLAACGLLLQFFCFLRFLWICLVIFYYLLLIAWFLFLSLLFIFLHLYFLVSPSIIPFTRLHLSSSNACSSSYLWKFFFCMTFWSPSSTPALSLSDFSLFLAWGSVSPAVVVWLVELFVSLTTNVWDSWFRN